MECVAGGLVSVTAFSQLDMLSGPSYPRVHTLGQVLGHVEGDRVRSPLSI